MNDSTTTFRSRSLAYYPPPHRLAERDGCVLVLAVLLQAGSVYGYLVNYFGVDAQLYVAATIGAAALGFIFGWIARGRF